MRTVGSGQWLLNNRAADARMSRVMAEADLPGPVAGLNEQERTVLSVIGAGMSNRQIAERDVPGRGDGQQLGVAGAGHFRNTTANRAAVLATEIRSGTPAQRSAAGVTTDPGARTYQSG